MAKRTLQIATADGARNVEGTVMHLWLGQRRVKVFVATYRGEQVLSEYATGYRIGGLGGIKLARYVGDGFTQLTDRQAAQAILDSVPKAAWDRAIAGKPTLNA